MKDQETIADRVKCISKTLKLTQKELSQKIDISITYIFEVEQGMFVISCGIINLLPLYTILLWHTFTPL